MWLLALLLAQSSVNSLGMRLMLVPAGEFVMGSPLTEAHRRADEAPRLVSFPRPFLMSAYPVTQDQYFAVMQARPSWFAATGPGKSFVAGLETGEFPVERVRWDDAVTFCRRLSALPAEQQAHRVYRLPTEAEFEYAAWAGGRSVIPSTVANFHGEFPVEGATSGPYLARTTKVGSYPPNELGLYDLQGNVWQWCSDAYDGNLRVLRGCGWNAFGLHCRLAAREKDHPGNRTSFVGFRVVAEVTEP